MGKMRCGPAVALLAVVVATTGGVVARAQFRLPPPDDRGQVTDFRPVTDAMLQNPNPADWLNWRRTLDGWGYSPLRQINRDNAHQLQLTWATVLGPGLSEPTPLVYNGIMYIPEARGIVEAFDAVTGDPIWTFRKEFEAEDMATLFGWRARTRSVAIYGAHIYVATPDAHLVALNAVTGDVVWDHTVADYTLGYRYSSGPVVVNGIIVAGMTGCDHYKDDVCFISAHDAGTGEELWRTSTIAGPGEPGGDTWGDLPLAFRAGGDAWIPGSYDPDTNLMYWSTAQPKPWARVSRGTDGDALYTSSVLALEPETGEVAWYYQVLPGESHDMDEVYESVLIDHSGQRSLFKMGKLGILWEIDRTTGAFVAARDLGYQTLIDVDPINGEVTYRPGTMQQVNLPIEFCTGGRSWEAMAYHPDTQALYIPISRLACGRSMSFEVEKEIGGGGYRPIPGHRSLGSGPHPKSPDHRGAFVAMDVATGEVLWRHETRAPASSAALTTAGGLAIVGDSSRYLYVHDVTTGEVLFRARMPTRVLGYPITYEVRGKQYLAIPTGSEGEGGNAVYVFTLPER